MGRFFGVIGEIEIYGICQVVRLSKVENPWDAVIREVKEETGLVVNIDRLQGIYFKPEEYEYVFSFICSICGGKQILTDEADQIEYLNVDDILNNHSIRQLERVQDYFNDKNKTYLKNQ